MSLRNIRTSTPRRKGTDEVFIAIGWMAAGLVLGALRPWFAAFSFSREVLWQKILLTAGLPALMQGKALWMLMGLAIAVYARGPWRGGIRVGCFFMGALLGTAAYQYGVSGILPGASTLPSLVPALMAVPLGALFWYARGRGGWGCALTAAALAFFVLQTFSWGMWYVHAGTWPEIAVLVLAALVLFRPTRTYWLSLAGAVVLALLLRPAQALLEQLKPYLDDLWTTLIK